MVRGPASGVRGSNAQADGTGTKSPASVVGNLKMGAGPKMLNDGIFDSRGGLRQATSERGLMSAGVGTFRFRLRTPDAGLWLRRPLTVRERQGL
jgi:hypothetical protein